jgi:hypothetical protein
VLLIDGVLVCHSVSRLACLIAIGLVPWASAFLVRADQHDQVDFNRDIQPILSQNCFPCHGPDAEKREADLRLDTRSGALEDRGDYAAIVPGDLTASEVVKRIENDDEDERMPPADSNLQLTKNQIDLIKRWIAAGAEFRIHWAFIRPETPTSPPIEDTNWPRNEIDFFILSRLEHEGLQPSQESAPAKWLRRVSLDLIGLPPSLAELDRFLADVAVHGEKAYENTVKRLLESPHYGERMAMDWLDVARYADSNGYTNDSTRSMWRWRDWVIESFNDNMPYDQFVQEQLAGDLMPEPSLEQRIATGFCRNHGINSEGGIIGEEYRVEYVADRVRTMGMAWLGLTLECARCHDHKYDPFSQEDYYRLFAFFNNVPEVGEDARVANSPPMIPAPTQSQRTQLAHLEQEIRECDSKLAKLESACHWSTDILEQLQLDVDGEVDSEDVTTDDTEIAFHLTCDAGADSEGEYSFPDGTPTTKPGVSGDAFEAVADRDLAIVSESSLQVGVKTPFTLMLWLQQAGDAEDVSLMSGVDYRGNPIDAAYGKGMELRLVGGEVEFRIALRYPNHSITVRSDSANITQGQWHHVGLVYEGGKGESYGRAHASWVRLFVNGQEVATKTLYDDLQLPIQTTFEPCGQVPYRIGHDLRTGSSRFVGLLDDIRVYNHACSADQVSEEFFSKAVPYAGMQQKRNLASKIEPTWLKSAALRHSCRSWGEAKDRRDSLWRNYLALKRSFPTVMVMQDLAEPRQAYLLERGQYDIQGNPVEAGVPEVISAGWSPDLPQNRLGLAQWLTHPDHPLTARVVVNRLWQHFFGFGLVKTSEDFGVQGERPSHPKLLDWLARDFIDSGWDQKAIVRSIVLSSTYRQNSAVSSELIQHDPENRLLARSPRVRLPGEIIRDQALSLAGLLNPTLGGPSVRPYQPDGLYDRVVVAANLPGTKWVQSEGDDLYRRSLYIFWKRTVPYPIMLTFDTPTREVCTVRRSNTNTPLQALVLMNSSTFLEASRKLAERMILEGGENDRDRLAFAFRSATGRKPTRRELTVLENILAELRQQYSDNPDSAEGLLTAGASPCAKGVSRSELAAFAGVASVILNLDETITGG